MSADIHALIARKVAGSNPAPRWPHGKSRMTPP